MKVTINNKDYIIKFHHQNNVQENNLSKEKRGKTCPSFTHCWIECDGVKIAEATANLHINDKNFNKEYGRKWSLRKVLLSSHVKQSNNKITGFNEKGAIYSYEPVFSKEERREIYRQYFKLTNSKYSVKD